MDYLKKSKSLILMVFVVLSVSLTGCKKSDVDYELVSETERLYNDDSKFIGKTLEVPAGVQVNMSTKGTNLDTIEVTDDDIYVPECENMKIYSFEEYDLSGEMVRSIVNALFDEQAGVYLRNHEAETKEEIRNTISIYKDSISNMSKSNEEDANMIPYFENEIEELNKRLADAPDSLPLVKEEDFEKPYHTYIGKYGGKDYELELSNYYDYEGLNPEYKKGDVISLNFYSTNYTSEKLAGNEEYDSIIFGSAKDFAVDTEGMANEALISKEEAEAEAFDFLNKLGIDDFVIDWTDDMLVLYAKGANDPYMAKLDGYTVRFKRTLNNSDIFALDMLDIQDEEMCDLERFSEYAEICIDDTGVISASLVLYTDTKTMKSSDAKLLSWNDMLARANEEIAEYFKENKSKYKSVSFNEVSLQYVMSIDGNGNKYYVPAWVFIEYDDCVAEEERSNYDVQNLVGINAIDGNYIDIYGTAKELSTVK